MFTPNSAPGALANVLETRGLSADGLTPADGVASMLEFYRSARAAGCPLEAGGDMLLFQWGTYDWGKGEFFELDLARQLIPPADSGDGEGIWQLHMTFRFPPSKELRGLGRGDRWCGNPQELPDFKQYVEGSDVLKAVANRRDGAVEIYYEEAG
jgi:hypothetical protein